MVKTIGSPWFSVGVTGVVSAGKAYFNEEDAAYDDFDKALVGGTIDAIASIGPIDGALIGAKFGLWGAVGGLVVGFAILTINGFLPNWTNTVKDGAYKLVDKTREIGQSISATFSTIKKTAGTAIRNKANETVDKMQETTSNIKEKTENIGNFLSKNINSIWNPLLGF